MSLESLATDIYTDPWVDYHGRIRRVRRDSVRLWLPEARVGTLVKVKAMGGDIPMEIVSLDPAGHVAMPLNDLGQVELGDKVVVDEPLAQVSVGESLLGSVVDSLCIPYDAAKTLELKERASLYGENLNPMDRELIRRPIDLGIRAINACLTCGQGQRQGIFSGSGVGKSVLLGMMSRYTSADVVVISLIGERGREVREFIERDLGPQGLQKSVVVVETADRSAVRRVRSAFTSAAICEYFRQKGANVLWLMDSLTRFAMAQREIGMAAGEPPTTKGYTPSVFSSIARLVERAGNWGAKGSITGLFTVLVEGDDLEDPVADHARSILDGHIVLSRRLANRGHYPAIDILSSVSRVMDSVVDKEHVRKARLLKEVLARYQENEDAIQIGMYNKGSNPAVDECIDLEPSISNFLRQEREAPISFGESKNQLFDLIQ